MLKVPPVKFRVPALFINPLKLDAFAVVIPALFNIAFKVFSTFNVPRFPTLTLFWVISLFTVFVPAVIDVVPFPIIVPRLYVPPANVKLPLFSIVPLFVKVLFTVIIFVPLFVNVALLPTVILFWVIVPLFVTVTGASVVPAAILVVPVPVIA